jgi:hypothetical protein
MDEQRGSGRARGLTAVILGFFAASWFSWANADAPDGLPVWLTVGSVASLAVAVGGLVLAIRSPASSGAIWDRSGNRRYGIIVGIEFALAFVGSAVLGASGQSLYIPAWVCAVVGIHFLPLAPVLHDRGLVPLGILMTLVGVAALVVGLMSDVAPSTVAGLGAGVLLLGYAALALGKQAFSRT